MLGMGFMYCTYAYQYTAIQCLACEIHWCAGTGHDLVWSGLASAGLPPCSLLPPRASASSPSIHPGSIVVVILYKSGSRW